MSFGGISSSLYSLPDLPHDAIRTDGSNNLYFGEEKIFRMPKRSDSPVFVTQAVNHWEVRCALYDSTGDGTVPSLSGGFPRGGERAYYNNSNCRTLNTNLLIGILHPRDKSHTIQ